MDRRSRLSRRQFVAGAAGLGLVAGCGRLPWQAQQPMRMPRVGYLLTPSPEGASVVVEPVRAGLRELGYVIGSASDRTRRDQRRRREMAVLASPSTRSRNHKTEDRFSLRDFFAFCEEVF